MDTNHTRVKQKLPRRPRRVYESFQSRHRSQKSFTLTIPWNLASLFRNHPGIMVRQRHTCQKQMGLQRESSAQKWKKGHLRCCCSQVWTKNGWRIPWSGTAICETFRIFCLMGRHHMKGGSECLLTDQSYCLEQWSKITRFLRRTYREYVNLVQKSCQEYSSVMYYARRESGKETFWSQSLKNWRKWTHRHSTPEGSMQRKCWRWWKVDISHSQSQIEQPISGGDRRLRTSTLIRDRPEQGEEQEVLRGESDGLSSSTPLQDDSTRDDSEAKNDLWSLQEISFTVIRWNPESSFTRREKNHFLFRCSTSTLPEIQIHHWMYCWRKYWWLLERGWRKRLNRCMDRFHKIHFIERKATWRIYMVRGEIYEETNNLKTWQCTARNVEAYVCCSERQNKTKVGCRETKPRLRQTVAWYLLHWTWGWRIQTHHQK